LTLRRTLPHTDVSAGQGSLFFRVNLAGNLLKRLSDIHPHYHMVVMDVYGLNIGYLRPVNQWNNGKK